MKVIVESTFDTPLVSFQIANRVGSCHEAAGSEGLICHTTELSLRGAGDLDRTTLDESIDALGAGLGFGLRRDYVSLRGNCLDRHLETLFDLAISVLAEPRFEAAEHEKLLRETLYDLDELRDDDTSLAHRFFSKYCHPGHPYSRTALGTAESVSNFQLDDVCALYPRLMSREELVLGITGPVTEEQGQALAAKIPVGKHAPLPISDLTLLEAPKGRRLILIDKPERQQCQVLLGHMAPIYGSNEHDLLRIAETAFGGMFSSRLMQEIRVKHGWSYGAQCALHRARGNHYFQVSLAPSVEQCAPALARTLEMLDELAETGLKQDEFDFTRSYLVGSSAFTHATAMQRLFRKVQEELFQMTPGYGNEFPQRVEASSLSAVNEAIASSLQPKDLCVIVVATADLVRKELESLPFDSIEVVDYRSY